MSGDYSIHTGEIRTLGTWDYVIFVLTFVASAAIGFYHAYKDRYKTNVEEFHLSGRKMHPIPVSMSLTATFISALTLLGNPTEIYTNGTMFYWIVVAMLISTVSSAHLFLPVFYNLNKTSTFEYIEIRFGSAAKVLASAVFVSLTVVYLGFVIYAPSLAFQAVTGLSLWGTMIGVAAVCTLYTTLGGMKTVLWTDSLQLCIMIAGLIVVLVRSSSITGGFVQAWEIAKESGRIIFTDFNPDPRTRHSVWSMAVGGGLFWTYLYGIHQAQVQRACSLPTLKRAQIAIWINYSGLVLIITLTCMIGVTMFAFYKDCDPVKLGLISKSDQLLPLMVLDILGHIPCLAGLFVACVFSGGLSSISSGLSAMSAVILEDFVKPFCCKSLSGKTEILISKLLIIVLGCLQLGVAFLISQASGLVMQLSYSLTSLATGPLMGLFVSGLVFPWTNKYGAITGFVASISMMSWLIFGTAIEKPSGTTPPLAVSASACNLNVKNISDISTTILSQTTTLPLTPASNYTTLSPTEEPFVYNFYRMSYMWYTGFGLIIHITIALCVSFVTGRTDPNTLDHKLMIPFFYKLCPFLPEKYRKYLLLGVNYDVDKDSENKGTVPMDGFDNMAFTMDKTEQNKNKL